MISAIPLILLPLIAYNLVGFVLSGADPWATELFGITMPSGMRWSVKLGDVIVVFAILVLFLEVMRAARAASSISNHVLSAIVLIVYVVEFIVAGVAAHSVFFILTLIALFDVVAGFSITIRTAPSDDTLGEEPALTDT